jgi:type 1 glutamine amidotransferase
MKPLSLIAAAAIVSSFGAPASAEPATDCPMRDAPFSASTPLIDILLSPAARGAVEKELGVSFDSAPPQFSGTEPPSFAAILTLREGAGVMRQPAEAVERAIAALKDVPVTKADKVARCARYDNDKPRFDLPEGKPNILLFGKINGFKDVPSFDAAHAAIMAMGKKNGWTIAASDKGGAMSPEILGQFDAIIWNNISGDVLTLSQRQALRDYVEGGGGFVGVHGTAGDPAYFWDWYVDTLIGARFAGHPLNPQCQAARVVVEDGKHPAAQALPAEWVMKDEWYSFKTNPRDSGARIIARLDESTYSPEGRAGQQLRMGEDHPIAWSKIIGKGRSFYSAIGHMPETYTHPLYNAMLEDAIAWATGISDEKCGD